ncbi:hypothetical protein OSTOST_12120, partial [Ostertagia ostertagi]
MQFSLVSPRTQTKAPFCLGFAFRRGDVPAGSIVTSNLAALQVTPRTTWPDGSLKFAQVAGFADLTANVLSTVRLRASANDGRVISALGLADLKKTGLTAEVSAGSFGTAAFAGADWDTPHTTWVSGPQMSSWVFRKPVGSDPHLVAWLEVRLYAGGAVEVLPWVENGYLMVAAPVSKAAVFSFKLGGAQRFSASIDLPHHCRTPLISGTALSYWLGTDPDITPRHDLAYLQATEQVPTYSARVAPSAAVAQGLATTWSPLDKANLNYYADSMRSPGYQSPIGLLPEHDVLYLTCESPATYGAVVRNGYASGRYGMHYRDEKTQRPIRFSQYPNLALAQRFSGFYDQGGSTRGQYTPTATGTAPVSWDCAHSPAIGYLAYLVTGRFYFMEAVQFAATFNYLGKGDADPLRKGALGLVQSCVGAWQVRAAAWQWRTLTMALNITPDSDATLKDEFLTSVQANIDHYHSIYVAQPNNPFGWVQGESYNSSGPYFDASWMQDFVTAAWGFSLSVGLPVPAAAATKMEAFFRWKARTAVMRLGPASGFWYINGAPYTMSVSPVQVPDFQTGKGPWHTSDAQVYATTYATPQPWMSKVEGQLAAEILPGERAMWGNLMPAISYAVRHGVPGATAAWQRLTQASNFPALRDAFHTAPVWSVAPARITPAWLAGKPLGQWIEIPNTAGAGGSAVDAFCGMAVNDLTSEPDVVAGRQCVRHDVAEGEPHGVRAEEVVQAFGLLGPAGVRARRVGVQQDEVGQVGGVAGQRVVDLDGVEEAVAEQAQGIVDAQPPVLRDDGGEQPVADRAAIDVSIQEVGADVRTGRTIGRAQRDIALEPGRRARRRAEVADRPALAGKRRHVVEAFRDHEIGHADAGGRDGDDAGEQFADLHRQSLLKAITGGSARRLLRAGRPMPKTRIERPPGDAYPRTCGGVPALPGARAMRPGHTPIGRPPRRAGRAGFLRANPASGRAPAHPAQHQPQVHEAADDGQQRHRRGDDAHHTAQAQRRRHREHARSARQRQRPGQHEESRALHAGQRHDDDGGCAQQQRDMAERQARSRGRRGGRLGRALAGVGAVLPAFHAGVDLAGQHLAPPGRQQRDQLPRRLQLLRQREGFLQAARHD